MSEYDDLIKDLTPSEKEAWSHIESMIESPGFKIVKRDLEELRDNLVKHFFHVKNWEDYIFTKGQLDAMNLLINIEQRALQQFQQAVANRQAVPDEEGGGEVAFV
jgi:hypothetical protein